MAYKVKGTCVDASFLVLGPYQTNVYVVSDGSAIFAVDPASDAKKIAAALGGRKLDAIVLTHRHSSLTERLDAKPVLIAGDTLFFGSIGRTDFSGGSMSAMRKSLKRLAVLPDDTVVLPGHGNLTTIGGERRRVFAFYA